MKRCLSIRVTGRVQGVFYRASARDKAQELGLCGFVKNESDGAVYILVEGEEAKVKEFEAWCRQGPPRAQVEQVGVEEAELQHFSVFEIRR